MADLVSAQLPRRRMLVATCCLALLGCGTQDPPLSPEDLARFVKTARSWTPTPTSYEQCLDERMHGPLEASLSRYEACDYLQPSPTQTPPATPASALTEPRGAADAELGACLRACVARAPLGTFDCYWCLTPRPTPRTPTSSGRGVLPADCNADGQVDTEEASIAWMINYGSAPLEACAAADADGDGVVTASEAQWATWIARRGHE